MPRAISLKYSSITSWTITATVCVRLRASPLASMFGSKSSALAASRTFCRVRAATGCDEPLSTRDTVAVDTIASAATSSSDGMSAAPPCRTRGVGSRQIGPRSITRSRRPSSRYAG